MENKEKRPVLYRANEVVAEVLASGIEKIARPLRRALEGLEMAALGGGIMGIGVTFEEKSDNKNKGED